MQTKKHSLVEAVTNTMFGFVVSMFLSYYVLPLFGLHQSIVTSFEVVLIFTFFSIARNYIVRRVFAKNGIRVGR